LQPVVSLTANGAARAEVKAGESVAFEAIAEAPANAGRIVKAEWDFEGDGGYALKENVAPQACAELRATHAFSAPGVYFPALRVTSQRTDDADSPFTQVQNLGRVRVVVS
jgi:hypothetical protein